MNNKQKITLPALKWYSGVLIDSLGHCHSGDEWDGHIGYGGNNLWGVDANGIILFCIFRIEDNIISELDYYMTSKEDNKLALVGFNVNEAGRLTIEEIHKISAIVPDRVMRTLT